MSFRMSVGLVVGLVHPTTKVVLFKVLLQSLFTLAGGDSADLYPWDLSRLQLSVYCSFHSSSLHFRLPALFQIPIPAPVHKWRLCRVKTSNRACLFTFSQGSESCTAHCPKSEKVFFMYFVSFLSL